MVTLNTTEVFGFKLTNGMDLIGKLTADTADGYTLEDSFFLQTVPKQDGSLDIQYVPVTVLAKPSGKSHMGFNFTLPRISVLFKYELNPGIVEGYTKYTSVIDLSFAPSAR